MQMKNNQTSQRFTHNGDASMDEELLLEELLARLDEKKTSKARPAVRTGTASALSIDYVELFVFVLSKWYLIVASMLICALGFGIFALRNVVPMYTATAKLHIKGQSNASTLTDLQIGSWLTYDYQEVFAAWEVQEMVAQQLGDDRIYAVPQIDHPADTNILTISVTENDPQLAADVANAYAAAAKKFVANVIGMDEPSIFSKARAPISPSTPGRRIYAVRGLAIGFAVMAFVLALIFILDKRPKSPEDILKHANVPTLGVVPISYFLSDGKALRREERRR